ncbi:hypothetical protein F0562_006203 [Nyssa sinensis]|uniref:Uncharacterized protein n=1 Tax=Nyssa sinensis TaxID=561372 RepID=A0A5J5AMC9_9ASTE|nr:hypothetical protein F0562_006203 [Nyssa sinensis]
METMHTDCESILVQLKHQQKQLKFKRRWLMGLPMSYSEKKQLKESNFQKDRTIPESLLREDDVFYETIKTFVENGFGASSVKRVHHRVHKSMQPVDLLNDERKIFSLIDDLTNKGLYLFVEILTGGSIKFEKTRLRMKRIIRGHLPKILINRNDKHQIEISKKISELLKDPCNFHGNCVTLSTPASKSCHAAAAKILDGLEDFPFQTLSAMHRKLEGVQGYMPQLQPPRSGSEQGRLINELRKRCMKKLSKLGEGDELQEPLAKAMAVAGLSLRLKEGWTSETEFQNFSPEIEALQDEIVKTIWLLRRKVTVPEMKNLQLLLDPIAKLPQRGLRQALRELLTEYLFECSDMDMIPECLLEALSITNRSSRSVPYRFCLKKEIEEEVECVLGVSAQTKQIVWDFLPEHEFDHEYVDAYMEDSEETDDGDGYDDNEEQQVELLGNSRFRYSHDLIEGIGETILTNSKLPDSTTKGKDTSQVTPNRRSERNYVERQETTIDLAKHSQFVPPDLTNGEANFMHDKHRLSRNQYLAIQEACDKTSMVAYRLIGRLLDEFAQIEGINLDSRDVSYLRSNGSLPKDSPVTKQEQISYKEDAHGSIITEVLEELIPSFRRSEKGRLMDLMA